MKAAADAAADGTAAAGRGGAASAALQQQAADELRRRAAAELLRRRARTSLAAFTLATCPGYLMGWFHEEVCAVLDRFLEDVLAKRSPRLILSAPPRHGKSELVSRRFPAFALGRCPGLELIACSYSAALAGRMCRDVQRIIDDERYHAIFPHTALGGSIYTPEGVPRAVRLGDYFEIAGHAGRYRAAGTGGSITGMGAQILIIDDPVKDRREANSAAVRRSIRDWFTAAAYTRLAPGGGVIIMCTRWHSDDLPGSLLAQDAAAGGGTWQELRYEALAGQDSVHRRAGEALHPARFDKEALERIRTAVGERDWAALYQQRPVPDGGGLFKESWLRFYGPAELPQRFDRSVISWDMSFKNTDGADYAVGQVWGRRGADFYLIDQVRARMDFVETKAAFTELAARHPKVLRKLVEDKANGPAVIAALRSSVPGIVAVNPRDSKEARAFAVSTLWEAGNVHIPDPAWQPWAGRDFIPELLSFPGGAHDDQVDAMTQALNDLKQGAARMDPTNISYLGRVLGA